MTSREQAARAPGTRCEAHTRAWRNGALAEQGFDVAHVSDVLADGTTVVWLDLLQPDEADMAVLVEELGLHPLAIEDALHAHQRPKLDRYADHLFLAAYAVHEQDGELLPLEIAAFLTPRALVTVRKDPRIAVGPVLERWDVLRRLAPSGVGYLAHGLVDVLVDGYVTVAQDLDDTSDDLEDQLFADDAGTADLQRRTFDVRSDVTTMRRVVLPMRDVVTTMRRPDVGLVDDRIEPYLRDVDDHVARVLDSLETTREQLATALDTTIAMQGQRLNETVFRLTAWAAVLAVTTAITGYFGQNIPYPGIEEQSGFWASTVLLVASTLGLYAYFKRKGWL